MTDRKRGFWKRWDRTLLITGASVTALGLGTAILSAYLGWVDVFMQTATLTGLGIMAIIFAREINLPDDTP